MVYVYEYTGREISCCLPFEQHNKKVAEKFKFIRILHGLWQRLEAHFHCNTQQILKVRESFRFL